MQPVIIILERAEHRHTTTSFYTCRLRRITCYRLQVFAARANSLLLFSFPFPKRYLSWHWPARHFSSARYHPVFFALFWSGRSLFFFIICIRFLLDTTCLIKPVDDLRYGLAEIRSSSESSEGNRLPCSCSKLKVNRSVWEKKNRHFVSEVPDEPGGRRAEREAISIGSSDISTKVIFTKLLNKVTLLLFRRVLSRSLTFIPV